MKPCRELLIALCTNRQEFIFLFYYFYYFYFFTWKARLKASGAVPPRKACFFFKLSTWLINLPFKELDGCCCCTSPVLSIIIVWKFLWPCLVRDYPRPLDSCVSDTTAAHKKTSRTTTTTYRILFFFFFPCSSSRVYITYSYPHDDCYCIQCVQSSSCYEIPSAPLKVFCVAINNSSRKTEKDVKHCSQ